MSGELSITSLSKSNRAASGSEQSARMEIKTLASVFDILFAIRSKVMRAASMSPNGTLASRSEAWPADCGENGMGQLLAASS